MTSSFRLHLSLPYARSERDYLVRRERANIGSYSSRLYGAYVPRGFPPPRIFHFPCTFPPPPPPPSSVARLPPPPLFYPSRRVCISYTRSLSCLSVCSLYFWHGLWEIRRFRRPGSTHLSREKSDAIYCTGVSVARKSTAIKDPRASTRPRDICKK